MVGLSSCLSLRVALRGCGALAGTLRSLPANTSTRACESPSTSSTFRVNRCRQSGPSFSCPLARVTLWLARPQLAALPALPASPGPLSLHLLPEPGRLRYVLPAIQTSAPFQLFPAAWETTRHLKQQWLVSRVSVAWPGCSFLAWCLRLCRAGWPRRARFMCPASAALCRLAPRLSPTRPPPTTPAGALARWPRPLYQKVKDNSCTDVRLPSLHDLTSTRSRYGSKGVTGWLVSREGDVDPTARGSQGRSHCRGAREDGWGPQDTVRHTECVSASLILFRTRWVFDVIYLLTHCSTLPDCVTECS